MLAKVWDTVLANKLIKPGEMVIVGVSGGPDSLALLHALHLLSEKGGFKLHVAHLNHSFRGIEADDEAEWVRDISKAWGIPCTVKKEDLPEIIKQTGQSPQEAGHLVRRDFFFSLLKELNGQKIALGHQADDQAETIIMHLLSGAGAEGLQGIRLFNMPIIRPLLFVTRTEIEEYCRLNGLEPRRDPSNEKNVYLRNKVRNLLLPWLKENINPNLVNTLQKTAAIMQNEEDYWFDIVSSFLERYTEQTTAGLRLGLASFNKEQQAVQRRVVRKIYQQVTGGQGPSYQHVEDICNLAMVGQVGKRLTLPDGLTVVKEYQDLLFVLNYRKEKARPLAKRKLAIPGDTFIAEAGLWIRASVSEERPQAREGQIHLPLLDNNVPLLICRSRQSGDWLSPKGLKGRKKLKEYYIDHKISQDKRDGIMLIADGSEILWIPGLFTSSKVNNNQYSDRYLVLKIIKGDKD